MSEPWFINSEFDLPELKVSNNILGDKKAIANALNSHGYLFFKNVVDARTIAEVKGVYTKALFNLGLVDSTDPASHYNGNSLSALPESPISGALEEIAIQDTWKVLARSFEISNTVLQAVGGEPFWIPLPGYRISKPGADPSSDRFEYVHQDSFFNRGIPFLSLWVPLVEMGPETGGLAIAEGQHKKETSFHETGLPPNYNVPVGDIPRSSWRYTSCSPGDLIVFDINTPHTGLTNISKDQFRMSIDIRVLKKSSTNPVIGTVLFASKSRIQLREDSGKVHSFALTDGTYCRGGSFARNGVQREEIPNLYEKGVRAIVSARDGNAIVLRPCS